jgi:hypothetical protein
MRAAWHCVLRNTMCHRELAADNDEEGGEQGREKEEDGSEID